MDMAASYIRSATLALVLVAVVVFGIGFLVGTRARKVTALFVGVAVLGVALLVGLMLGVHALGVSGPLIMRQIVALTFEVWGALLGGCLTGLLRQRKRGGAAVGTAIGFALYVVATVAIQIGNAQPVLDALQAAGVLKPRDTYKPETNKTCPENLKGIYNAFEQYVELNDSLPPAANWEDNTDLTSRIPQDEWLHCPSVSGGHDAKFGYAYNDALTGKKLNLNGNPLKTLPNAAKIPLLYDSTNLSKNAHDTGTSLPKPGRHGGRNNILYLDGHVEAVAPK